MLDPVLSELDYCVLQKVQGATGSHRSKVQNVTFCALPQVRDPTAYSAQCKIIDQALDFKSASCHVAVPQELAFAVKNQNCGVHSFEAWASSKIRLDYGYRIWQFQIQSGAG